MKASKTDPFKEGATIYLTSLATPFCPVKNLSAYCQLRGNKGGPLFQFDTGAYLTRAILSSILAKGLPGEINLNTHSFRIGGATAAFKAGLSPDVIKKLGRWKSDAYQKYIRHPRGHLDQALVAIANTFLKH